MNFRNHTLELQGERLLLRTMDDTHATDTYAGWLNDPNVHQYLGTKSATIAELRSYIAERNAQSDALLFGIFLKEDRTHIGTIKLEPINIPEKNATIAVMIGDTSQWGKGYAGEAMHILIDWCFQALDIDEIRLGVIADNSRAIRAYEKLGFRETRRDIQTVRYGEDVYDHVWMALQRPSS